MKFNDIELFISDEVFQPGSASTLMSSLCNNKLLENTPEALAQINFVDFGCGCGAIGLDALKKYPEINHLYLLDVDETAIELCNLNANINKLNKQKISAQVKGDFKGLDALDVISFYPHTASTTPLELRTLLEAMLADATLNENAQIVLPIFTTEQETIARLLFTEAAGFESTILECDKKDAVHVFLIKKITKDEKK